MKKKLFVTIIALSVLAGGFTAFQTTEAQQFIVSFLKRSGDNILPVKSVYELGSSSVRWAKVWSTDLDVSGVLTLGGTVGSGGIDLDGNALILDADADSQLIASTDDRLDIQLGPSGNNLQYGVGVFAFQEGTTVSTTAGDLTLTPFGNIVLGNDALIQHDVNAGLTASITQTQGQGAMTAEINEVATVANVDDTVTLPSAVAGLKITVINNGANQLQIFPASGDDLGQGVNIAESLAAGSNKTYVSYDGTNWETG